MDPRVTSRGDREGEGGGEEGVEQNLFGSGAGRDVASLGVEAPGGSPGCGASLPL